MQLTAAIIVFGGTIGACLVNSTMADFIRGLKMGKAAFVEKKVDLGKTLDELVELAALSRREGLIALEAKIAEVKDAFLARTLEHAVDGVSAADLRTLMEADLALEEKTETTAAGVFEAAGGYAPTVGILGAVLGLIHVMENLDDPSKLGPGIAVAFVATVYGVGFANVVCLPMSFKLKRHMEHDQLIKQMVLEGVVGIQSGVAPGALRSKLKVYLGNHGGGHADKK